MTSERWTLVKELLNSALERDPSQRAAFLAEHCAGDAELRREVDSLLESFDDADDDFLESPPEHSKLGAFKEPTAPTLTPTPVPPPSGMRVGRYKVVEEIGRGGMGTVYRAFRSDDPLQKPVAIKILRRGMDHDFILRRFRNERTILGALDHPNIARLIDGGATTDGLPYFVMEYVEGGRNIVQYCDEERLSTTNRLRLFMKVCSAVQCAHDRRIIHRDIKPGNILIDINGQPKLLDFGIAKILDPDLSSHTLEVTATILRLMTPEYASPEQVRGGEITACSDVYSLGILLYELLTGHRPYRLKSKSPHDIAQVICNEMPERPSTAVGRIELITRGDGAVTVTPSLISAARQTKPSELRKSLVGDIDTIVLTAMRKEPERRYSSVSAFAEDIRLHLNDESIKAKPDTVWYRTSKLLRHNRTAVAASIAAILLSTGIMLAWRDYIDPLVRGPVPTPHTAPLTSFPGDETQPAFSPDGQKIAFVWEGENSDNSDIYIKPVHGVGLERITTNAAEDVSPVWSPDGQRIAWLRATTEGTDVFIAPAEPGAQHSRIASLYPNRIEAVGRHLDWAPDGHTLAAADKGSADEPFRIVSIELSTGFKKQLTTPPAGSVGDSNPAYSPDGKYIAFIRGVGSGVDDIFIKPVDGGPARRLTDDKRYIISLAWSADGRQIYFSSNRAGNHSLWRVAASGGKPERLATVGDNVSDPVLSRDGRLLAYSQFYQDTNIWSLDVQSLAKRKLIASTQYDSSPDFSSDGSSIIFRSSRSGTNEIWIAGSDGMNEHQVTKMGNTLSGSPKLSPDGKRVAFDSRPDGQPDIFVINTDGTGKVRITSEPSEDVVPNWSKDGQWIYFASNRSGSWQVWKSPANGGTPVQVTKTGGFAAKESSDGKWVYFSKGRSVSGLWRVRPDGTDEEPVLEQLKPGFWAYWAVVRNRIYFADRDPAKGTWGIYYLAEGRKDPQLLSLLDRPIIIGDQGMAASPDGSTLVWTQVDQSGSDILMLDLPQGR